MKIDEGGGVMEDKTFCRIIERLVGVSRRTRIFFEVEEIEFDILKIGTADTGLSTNQKLKLGKLGKYSKILITKLTRNVCLTHHLGPI